MGPPPTTSLRRSRETGCSAGSARGWLCLESTLDGPDTTKPSTTITISDADFAALASGKTTARDLFQHGKLRVDGDVAVAHRLGFLKGLI